MPSHAKPCSVTHVRIKLIVIRNGANGVDQSPDVIFRQATIWPRGQDLKATDNNLPCMGPATSTCTCNPCMGLHLAPSRARAPCPHMQDALQFVRPDAKQVFVGKRGGRESIKQPAIDQLLVEHCMQVGACR